LNLVTTLDEECVTSTFASPRSAPVGEDHPLGALVACVHLQLARVLAPNLSDRAWKRTGTMAFQDRPSWSSPRAGTLWATQGFCTPRCRVAAPLLAGFGSAICLFVPKPITGPGCQSRRTPDLGRGVHRCPLASMVGGGGSYPLGYSAPVRSAGDWSVSRARML
jgi:hypothetical protein